ncbi:hypothetical protein GCM10027073_39600 [Streptomyces chlorus]|uniref:NPCBM/NEW2 domain-containing protein n=1 Tax=Streptomyces chlorus TaxID=887452 RepID=A0ABW1DWA8_9ACTN
MRQPGAARDGVSAEVRVDAVDGTVTLATTGVLTGIDPARRIDVDVTGVERLTLRVTDGDEGLDSDHADWAGVRLLT